ncbi:PEP-CTERM sorting domain-containing protein [Schlesneria sp. DSM 10557]|uniref:PEP-CTERM sorting domain-containing protein n=1 Tax=Schlesneria sp. DSM 10557 TaxID=3044399 RepID=UPI00359F296C
MMLTIAPWQTLLARSVLCAGVLIFACSALNAGPVVITGTYEISAGVGLGINSPVVVNGRESTRSVSYSLVTEAGGTSQELTGISRELHALGAQVVANGYLSTWQHDGPYDLWGPRTMGSINFHGRSFAQTPLGVWAQGHAFGGSGKANVSVAINEPFELHIAYTLMNSQLGDGNSTLVDGGSGFLVLSSTPESPKGISVSFGSGGVAGAIPVSPYNGSGFASVVWGVNRLPGLSSNEALKSVMTARLGADDEQDESIARESSPPTFYSAPVLAGYGLDKAIFFSTVSILDQVVPASALSAFSVMAAPALYEVGDAVFKSFGPNFATITLPTAVPDLGIFTLRSGGFEAFIGAGEIFDFTTWHPDGVSEFELLGYGGNRVTFGEDALADYATGFTFVSGSVADFSYQLTAVPEPSSVALLLIGAASFLFKSRVSGFVKNGKSGRPDTGITVAG